MKYIPGYVPLVFVCQAGRDWMDMLLLFPLICAMIISTEIYGGNVLQI